MKLIADKIQYYVRLLSKTIILLIVPKKLVGQIRKLFYDNYFSDSPVMKKKVRKKFCEIIEGSKIYLEYGAGGSTIYALQHGPEVVYSVESDKACLNSVNNRINQITLNNNVEFYPVHANIGLTTNYGYPLFGYQKRHFGYSWGGAKKKWSKYSSTVWNIIQQNGSFPDFILIDGRFRVACVLQCLLNLPNNSNCILMLDDYRVHYGVIYLFIDRVELIAKDKRKSHSLLFKKRKDFNEILCEEVLNKYLLDPR